MQNIKHIILIALFVITDASLDCSKIPTQFLFFLKPARMNKKIIVEYEKHIKIKNSNNMVTFCKTMKDEMLKEKPEENLTLDKEYLIKICKSKETFDDKIKKEFMEKENIDPLIKHMEITNLSVIVKLSNNKDNNYLFRIGKKHLYMDNNEEENFKQEIEASAYYMEKNVENLIKITNGNNEIKNLFDNSCVNSSKPYNLAVVVTKGGINTVRDALLEEKKNGETDIYQKKNGETDIYQKENRKLLYIEFFKLLRLMETNNISFCNFKPDNMFFYQKKVILTDFAGLEFNNGACEFITDRYAPPETKENYEKSFNKLLEEEKQDHDQKTNITKQELIYKLLVGNYLKNDGIFQKIYPKNNKRIQEIYNIIKEYKIEKKKIEDLTEDPKNKEEVINGKKKQKRKDKKEEEKKKKKNRS